MAATRLHILPMLPCQLQRAFHLYLAFENCIDICLSSTSRVACQRHDVVDLDVYAVLKSVDWTSLLIDIMVSLLEDQLSERMAKLCFVSTLATVVSE